MEAYLWTNLLIDIESTRYYRPKTKVAPMCKGIELVTECHLLINRGSFHVYVVYWEEMNPPSLTP